ncbi:hypothetical protein [Stutzerimonas nitrititolerans]|uniref:hypothetical protein n=1 Tax=Stutzerimonas nitrititolerans TaxID=2482751 RepID=UPI00289F1033|nr:hypothetical protein [Stutzerimonas nitrititolerans]
MIHAQDRSLMGFGVTSAKPWQSRRGVVEVGNSTALAIQHATEKKTLRNYRTGIGNNNAKSQITGITGSFTLYDCGPSQLAMVIRAQVTGVSAGTVEGEAHPTGGLAAEHIVFKNLVDTTQPVTVVSPPATASVAAASGNAGDGTIGAVTVNGAVSGAYTAKLTSATEFSLLDAADQVLGTGTVGDAFSGAGLTFTIAAGSSAFVADDAFTITVAAGDEMDAGVDYIVTPYGIQLPAGSTIGERGVIVDYTKIKATVAEILKSAPTEQQLHFAGLNDAQDGLAYDATLWRVKFDDIAELPLNGEEYVSYNVTFELLQDYTRTGDDLSQYYTIRQAEKVAA